MEIRNFFRIATVFEAARIAGVRALVSAGWSNLGGIDVPEHVHLLGKTILDFHIVLLSR